MEKFLEQRTLCQWRLDHPSIWQETLINEKGLSRLANERGLEFSTQGDDVLRLWQLGLLQADLVISEVPLNIEGLILVEESTYETEFKDEKIIYKEFKYADNRSKFKWEDGVIGAINKLPEFPKVANLLFHPFRYYVLNKIDEKFKVRVNSTLLLRSPGSYVSWVDRTANLLKKWSSDESFSEKVERWNDIVTLAVGAEPLTFNKLFGYYRISHNFKDRRDAEKEFHKSEQIYYEKYKEILENIGLEKINEMISEIGRDGDLFEPNKEVYTLFRLTKRKYRLEKIKGHLGGLMYLMAIAETLRRAAERVFNVNLPEEDEIGFSFYPDGLKQENYGAERIFDTDETIKNNLVRDFGLDYTVRVRWYVEGETELGALSSILGTKKIQLINLRGRIAEKKALAFRDSLRDDIRHQIYSFVSLDGDRGDYVSVVKKAAKDEELFGRYFISKQDFEIGNFRDEELVEIFWKMAQDKGALPDEYDQLSSVIKGVKSGKALEIAVKKAVPALAQTGKGDGWGRAFMEYAMNNPKWTNREGIGETRPIVESVYFALHCINTNYADSFANQKVDAESGEIINRAPKEQIES